MSWNYRILEQEFNGEITFAIHEVYYSDNGKPRACSEHPTYPMGKTMEELKNDLAMYGEAMKKDVLDYSNF